MKKYLKKPIGIILFLAISFMFSKQSNGQVIQDSGNIFTEISSVISNLPAASGNDYSDPNSNQINTWTNALDNLFLGNYSLASNALNTIGYDLVEFLDTTTTPNVTYYILKTNGSNYWGTYVYNPNYCRPLVIQSPHPIKDYNTGKQGMHVFMKTQAMFFCLSGTNRCNSTLYSSCDGLTSMCSSSSEQYRISDLSHTTSSIFQFTTQKIFNNYSDTYFIQLHGFTKLSTDPYIILSNGTQVTPTIDKLSTFKTKLFDEDHSLTFKVAHIDLNWTRLRGFYNVQGRLINSSSDYCNANATTTNGRFFHMEQEKTKLRNNATGWNKVANALKNTFTCSASSVNQEYLNNDIHIYSNPSTNSIIIKGKNFEIEDIKIYNMLGQEMNKYNRTTFKDSTTIRMDISNLSSGIYIIKVKTTTNMVYKQ